MKPPLTRDPALLEKIANRLPPPRRAVVTGGMPYGNKDLHFGHVGGVFIHADTFARFLRDRIGGNNVIFVSGTDCYGSPITEGHRQKVAAGEFDGSLEDFARHNHQLQKDTLGRYLVSLSHYGGSALGRAGEIHREMSAWFLQTLYDNNHLKALSTLQFFDEERGVFLNGRQVVGRCPIAGCKSEKGYADECDLGHQYPPSALIAPKSMLTDTVPTMKEVKNWYLDPDNFFTLLHEWLAQWRTRPGSRPFVAKTAEEFLELPSIYLKREILTEHPQLLEGLPPHIVHDMEDTKKQSVKLEFAALSQRETACDLLSRQGIRYRTGKTMVPFRLTGDTPWGVAAPSLDGMEEKTFWVWPESLWAPISFTQTYLESLGGGPDAWKDWWTGEDAKVYQFIGQDNIYFYGPAQAMLFLGMQGKNPSLPTGDGDLLMTDIIANHHVLFMNKKASSSGTVKPPSAAEYLKYYTPEQLRAHFLGMGLGLRSVSSCPKPLDPDAKDSDPDPVLKEGNLFTNVLNRIARSCFYTAQKYTDSRIPTQNPGETACDMSLEAILDTERAMLCCEFHTVMTILDSFIRKINKYWSSGMKEADLADDGEKRLQILADCFHMLRTATVLSHPIAPEGTEGLADYFNVNKDEFFSWEHIFKPFSHFIQDPDAHKLRFLEPRVDFFLRHESQV